MIKMLASVNSVAEALLVLPLGVDIIDLKQPERGALGALDLEIIREIVVAIAGRCQLSATIGDLPMQPELIFDAVSQMATTGVDFIKIGFFPEGDWQTTIKRLGELSKKTPALIAVLFADTQPDLTVLVDLKAAGFTGVMLDTMNKRAGSLTQVMELIAIETFVSQAKKLQLFCGLAGSLTVTDTAILKPYEPDYLGFRGALCVEHNRVGQLDVQAIEQIRRTLH